MTVTAPLARRDQSIPLTRSGRRAHADEEKAASPPTERVTTGKKPPTLDWTEKRFEVSGVLHKSMTNWDHVTTDH